MLIDNMLFEQEWFSELPLRLRFLYIYLLTKCTKTGIFEINLRKFSYDINDGLPVTKDDIFKSFGNRVRPLGDSKGIFVDYISFNWVRDKPLDPTKNPLHRGLAQELSKYGLNFSMLCEMSNKKFKWVGDDNVRSDDVVDNHSVPCGAGQISDNDEPAKRTARFVPPTVEEVRSYCAERNNGIDAEAFVAFYESKGWMIGKNKMKSWKSAVITWEKGRNQNVKVNSNCSKKSDNAISSVRSDIARLF